MWARHTGLRRVKSKETSGGALECVQEVWKSCGSVQVPLARQAQCGSVSVHMHMHTECGVGRAWGVCVCDQALGAHVALGRIRAYAGVSR